MKLFLAAMTLFVCSAGYATSASAQPIVACTVTTGDVDFGDFRVVSVTNFENETQKDVSFGNSTFHVYVKQAEETGLRISMSSRTDVVSGKEELSVTHSDPQLGLFTVECLRTK